ncbi:ribonuclease III [Candidatus Margulisiibacteriota bacterium]
MLTESRSENLNALESKLGIYFEDKSLLDLALTHSSYAFENHKLHQDNERLEFFGDAVLKLAVSLHLFNRFPQMQEGDLTKIRAIVVSDQMLAKKAAELDLGSYMLFGQNELRSGGDQRESSLANALEALFGAYYLDQKNNRPVNDFIVNLLQDIVEEALNPAAVIDAKSSLQEYAQKKGFELPRYDVIREEGPDHDKTFVILVTLYDTDGEKQAEGTGKTKKEAEQAAARKILEDLCI